MILNKRSKNFTFTDSIEYINTEKRNTCQVKQFQFHTPNQVAIQPNRHILTMKDRKSKQITHTPRIILATFLLTLKSPLEAGLRKPRHDKIDVGSTYQS